jgi:hypothetical protein
MPPKKNNQKAEKTQEKTEKQTKLFSKEIVEPEEKVAKSRSKQFDVSKVDADHKQKHNIGDW